MDQTSPRLERKETGKRVPESGSLTQTETSANKPLFESENAKPVFSVVSMFCGCGGLYLGFLGGFTYMGEVYGRTPFRILAAYDDDEKCVETYRAGVGEHVHIKDLSVENAIDDMPSADVLIGGFPCQEFSACGPQGGVESVRGRLYGAMVRYLRTRRPKVMIAENVPHLRHMDGGRMLQKIVSDIEAEGYRCSVWTMVTADYGVPQRRVRLVLSCVRSDLKGNIVQPAKSHEDNHNPIDWAIGDLVADEGTISNQDQYFRAGLAQNGHGQGDEKNVKGKPAYSIRANAKSRVQFHYELERRLTVRECARLQTFPDNFVFPYAPTISTRQIGNAVPPLLAHRVALSVAEFLFNSKKGGKRGRRPLVGSSISHPLLTALSL